ncbi:hypothetical protein AX16_007071 [Volvariella volvacea WC 439]|nr:hypothetical protein AX16_007071 [Volvariella volvacea WC 439]
MPPGLSTAMTMKRIHREIADLNKEDLGPMTLAPMEDNLYIWRGTIPGPQGSVYEGGVFEIEVNLPSDYPFTAPKVLFKTRIYHMNISEHGNICIDILKHNWSPALSIFKVMLSLSSLLTDPNPKDPLVPSIATQYTRNRRLHDTTARQWTERYAKPKPTPPSPPSSSSMQLPPLMNARGRTRTLPNTGMASGRIGVGMAYGSGSEPGSRSGSAGPGQPSSSGHMMGERRVRMVIDPEPIVIDDDTDNEGQVNRRQKRKRELAPTSSRTISDGDAIEIEDDNEGTSEGSGPTSRKRRAVGLQRAPQRTPGVQRQSSEVIVIED